MRVFLLLTLLVLLGVPEVAAAEFNMEPPKRDTGAAPQIIGGRKVTNPEADWPATLKFVGGAGPCTSTVIGPRVVLTAAHCVHPGERGKLTIAGAVVHVTCDHHADYSSNYKLDVALCLADADIRLPGRDSAFETLADVLGLAPAGSPAILLGYGCRQTLGGGPAGVLYEGDTTIVAVSAADPYMEARGGAAVCYGDSGGAAFFAISPVERRVIAVNSQGDILERSMLSAVANAAIASFIRDWRTRKGVLVCGLDTLAGCHA
jgi:hypothetical protein